MDSSCRVLHSLESANHCREIYVLQVHPFHITFSCLLACFSWPSPLYPLMSYILSTVWDWFLFFNLYFIFLRRNRILIQRISKDSTKLDSQRGGEFCTAVSGFQLKHTSYLFPVEIWFWVGFFDKFKCHLSVGGYKKFIMRWQLRLLGFKQRFQVFFHLSFCFP